MTSFPNVGCEVIIVDGSEAHGDAGVVWMVQNGLCLVELESGGIWPVSEPRELIAMNMTVIENEVQSGTIESFADHHGLEMEVNERRLPVGDQLQYYASFRYVDEKDDCFLIATYGNGSTKEEAIANYAKKISMKTLVFRGNTDGEQVIQAWRFNGGW